MSSLSENLASTPAALAANDWEPKVRFLRQQHATSGTFDRITGALISIELGPVPPPEEKLTQQSRSPEDLHRDLRESRERLMSRSSGGPVKPGAGFR